MGPQLLAYSFTSSSVRNGSPRHRNTCGMQGNNGSSSARRGFFTVCGRSGGRKMSMTLVVLLACLAGFSTMTLQFMASKRGWSSSGNLTRERVGMAVQVDGDYGAFASDRSDRAEILSGTNSETSRRHRASANMPARRQDWLGEAPNNIREVPSGAHDRQGGANSAFSYDRKPGVDRRFRGQKTGRPPKTDEELYRPPPSRGPFGWGTDWAVGVSLPVRGEDKEGEVVDEIKPPWCSAPENRSFVEHVLDRRRDVKRYDRVAMCVRTKDMGRYLPEWVAYHWALGVDEFMIYDDESVDDTREVLDSFIRTDVVRYRQRRIPDASDRTAPLDECAQEYRDKHKDGDGQAPRWLLFMDSNEYIYSGDIVSTLADVLATYSDTCCLKVQRVLYGSSGLSRPPRGLVIENFLTHAPRRSAENGPPTVVVNLRPPHTLSGEFQRLTGPHEMDDCRCDFAPVEELAVNHYSLTLPEHRARSRAHAQGREYHEEQVDLAFAELDRNECQSDGLLLWSCTVREVLDRVANGRHMMTNEPFPSLSPHHPATHGIRPMDPFGVAELERTTACVAVVQSSPTAAGTAWGNSNHPPDWLQQFCRMRYVFVHSFEDTGGMDVVRLLTAHLWVQSHSGQNALRDGGATLTSALPVASELMETSGEALIERCGCSEVQSPGCWRYCPKLQAERLEGWQVNRTRRQLMQDWVERLKLKTAKPETPVFLVERDADMLIVLKSGLFPSVSQSVVTVRHPFCTPTVAQRLDGRDEERMGDGLAEWLQVWTHLVTEQLSSVQGSVWVVRFEDIVAQEVEVASALWAAVGLPPISSFPPPPLSVKRNADGEIVVPTAPLAAREPAALARAFELDDDDWVSGHDNASSSNSTSSTTDRPAADRRKRRRLIPAGSHGKVKQRVNRGDDVKGTGMQGRSKSSFEAGYSGSFRKRALIVGDALSRASSELRGKAFPDSCRNRIAACDDRPACVLERLRASMLMEFFGYGQNPNEVLTSQRFLWGKEELLWLGRRLQAVPSTPPSPPEDEKVFYSADEPSETLPGVMIGDIFPDQSFHAAEKSYEPH